MTGHMQKDNFIEKQQIYSSFHSLESSQPMSQVLGFSLSEFIHQQGRCRREPARQETKGSKLATFRC
jgi:hypothetical protein